MDIRIYLLVAVVIAISRCKVTTVSSCSSDTFQCKREIRPGYRCIPQNWVCDGDDDCPDRDDETTNCSIPTCASWQFTCQKGPSRCIAQGYVCDGDEDCMDGSDETAEVCKTRMSKGSHVKGKKVDNFKCLPNHYQCPGTHDCIPFSRVCDSVTDCVSDAADEGAHCVNHGCKKQNCSYNCKETLQGPMCYCKDGYAPNATACQDFNECSVDDFCDQGCTNSPGSYTCHCADGYTVQKNGYCQADNSISATLVISNNQNVMQINLDGTELSPSFSINGNEILALDFDYRNNCVCWITFVPHNGTTDLKCADLTDSSKQWTIPTQYKLSSVDQIAKDWLSGNWYFVDGKKERIFLCTSDGSHCLTIINTDMKRPKSIALDPTRGYMFYADWSLQAKIGRTDLDGDNRTSIATSKIVHPNGITLDYVNQHVYWGDSFLNIIERADYQGRNRIAISQGLDIRPRYGLSLFENFLYLSNHFVNNNSIVKIHRYNNSIMPVIIKDSLLKPGAIQVVHAVRQPGYVDVCKAKSCEQICIPTPGGSTMEAKCVCRAGFSSKPDDETKCERNKATHFLLYANAQQGRIHGISMNSSIQRDVMEPIENLNRPIALAFHAASGYVYFSDVSSFQIGRRKVADSSKDAEIFLHAGITSCEGLAIDWVGNNLYWTDDGHRTINVVRLDNKSLSYTIQIEDLNHPKAIAVDPNEGYMYWTDWVLRPSEAKAKIEKSSLDGENRMVLVNKSIQWPNSLTLDCLTKTLYWTDAYFDRIESIGFDGTGRKALLTFHSLKHPYGIAVYDNLIFWTESLSGLVNVHNITRNTTSRLRIDSHPLFDLIVFNKNAQQIKEGVPCATNNGLCSDICISLPNGYVCKCGKGRQLTADNKTCEDIPHYEPPSLCDKEFQFECKDGRCINIRRVCDGNQDCMDGSDEDIKEGGICSNISCPDPSMFACSNKRCIYMQFVCDGEQDCIDGTDESSKICANRTTCPANYILCTENHRCIPESWKCDHEKDCPEGSDEGSACGYDNCETDQFRCQDGRCIPYVYRCDNEYDCSDHSDEKDCGQWCDPVREFKCNDSDRCLPIIYRCDHEQNCKDGSDEHNCTNLCMENEFPCNSSDCINRSWRCDGDEDCFDGSDEWGCDGNKTQTCHATQEFLCKDKSSCIPKTWKCDRDNDCEDNSDEIDCAYISPCEAPKFTCKNNTNICLPPEKLCDGHSDCPDHSDEGRLCAYDMCANNDCSHTCHKSPDGFVCSCPEHTRLRADNRTCFDLDICERWGICSQNCSSNLGGHQCLCYKGYFLADDYYSCKPDDGVPIYIIYSNRHEIRRYDLGEKNFVSLVSGLRNTIALDFYYNKTEVWIFWTDVVDDKIYRGKMISTTLSNIEAIIDVGLATTEGLAIDWVAENIYWVESNLDQIEVAKLDGSNRSTLIAGNMTSPRAIVLDPREGALFWTDWDGSDPRIEGCSMSGENRHTIYDIKNIPTGGWPNGLAVDYEERRLYWIDARSDSVHTILYTGQGHRLVIQSHESLAHPFALTMFEHYIYWTDWRTNSLVMGSKFNSSGVQVIQRTFTQPFDLQILHPKRQPHVENPCKEKNGGCSHLCLIGVNHTAFCKCPHRMKLLPDRKSCEADNKFLLFVKENEIRGVDLDNGHYNVIPSITVPFVENATAIDYDVKEDRLYWTDIKRNVIRSAFINGTGIETIIDSGISNPQGFAIDWVSRNMYFSSYDEKKNEAAISVSKLNGAFRTKVVSSGMKNSIKLIKPTSIAIHPNEGLLFWCDLGGEKHTIVKANMDGSNAEVIIKDAASPASLSVDIESNILYWISLKKKTVNLYNLSTSKLKVKSALNMTSIMSMTMYGETIFLANSSNIIKLNKKTNKHTTMRDKTPHVYAMQVYDPSSRVNGSNACSVKNGGCEQMCLPTGKTSQICKCTAGFNINTDDHKHCDGISSFMLYSTESEIRGFSLDDPNRDALAPVSKISLASAVDFHAAQDHIYWVDSNSQSISRIKRDLTDRQTIIDQGIHGVEGMAIDWISGSVYWTDRGHDTIGVAKLDGSNRYIVMHGDMDKPRSICLHPVLGLMFFGDWGAKPKIVQAHLDGSNRHDFISTDIKAPFGLTVDYDTNNLYWCDKDLDVIEKVDISSGKRKVLIRNLTDCMALTVFEKHVYWADATEGGGSILRADKTTGVIDKSFVKKVGQKLKDIKVFDRKRQIGTNLCEHGNGGCEELCLFRGNAKRTCACSYGILGASNTSCEDYDAFLLYSEVTAIDSIQMTNDKDINSPLRPIQNEMHMKNVIGLAFHHKAKRIFYSDIQCGNIQWVYFNRTGFEILVDNVGAAEGLAFDSTSHYLYWTSYTNSSISRIELHPDILPKNRKQKTIIQLSTEDHPRAIVIDICKSRMFWTNWNDHKPSIQTAMLNGFKAHTIIDKHIRTPNGLAIDHRAQKLYWTDARLDKIERCSFDGTNRDVIVTAIPQHSFGIAVYGDFIYWTDWMLRAVLRANKYDGRGLKWLRKGIKRQPMGIIAVAEDTDDCTLNPCFLNAFGCEDICYVDDKGKPQCNCTKEHPVLLPDGKRCAVMSFKCDMTDFLCEDRFRCIPIEKTCNGIIDCPDGSDEMKQLCSQHRKCPAGYFSCNNSRCVSYSKRCNGHDDCDDDSDEFDCPCKEDEFRCKNGMCIQQKYRCDRDGDCTDLSDEMGCNLTCSDVEIEGEPLEGLISCNTTSACIYPSWRCDGSNDCWDHSDEANCTGTGLTECPDEAFMCATGSCIPPHWRCDKDNDCGDGSDEVNCTYSCDEGYTNCANDSGCIPKSWLCDGHEDCVDGTDEIDCHNRTCSENEFRCPNGRCIPLAWKCDQDTDCDDAADEKTGDDCPPVVCEKDEFVCLNRRCIKSIYYCNGHNDCGDNSDEPDMCVLDVCEDDQFKCANRGKCIPIEQRCNGLFDCPDHSDEDNCTATPPCGSATEFKCHNNVCISDDLVCNGHNDCGDKSDEPLECGINECYGISRPHICTQTCTDKKIGYVCGCHQGYKLHTDNKTCVDIDECNTTYPCSHHCSNTHGSYFCSCPKGLDYKLDDNHRTCKITKPPWPVLLVSNRYYIRNVTIPKGETKILTDKLVNSVAIDFDWEDKFIYWSDITSHSSNINRMHFGDDNNSTVEVLHSTTVRNPDGIAVDWVARNLYWCDKTTDTIEVSRLHGTYRKVLVREGLQEPRGLEVFPSKGLLYFTDWGDQPNIGRIWMDGTNRQTIIKDNLAWPNALTIDYMTEHIFWADASLDYIAMARLDGSGRRIVVSNIHYVPHVFGLSVFEDHIFWTDWEKMGIFYTNKFTGNKITRLISLVHRPMDLQVLHPYRQLPMNATMNGGYNPCENNGGCSHLCLLRPILKHQRLGSVCACPENHYLAADKATCISNCTSAQFLCNTTSKCIPFWWKCDNHTDCEDGSDEPDTCRPYYCSQPGLFQCDSATSADECFLPTVICDGTAKCSDGSDEKNCDVYSCMEHQFKCHSNNTCISKVLRCNGVSNCKNNEDEIDCPTTTCNPNQFNCSNGRCVPYVWRCDHDNDCGDWSDEPPDCKKLSCKEDHIKCAKSGRCIPKAWTCDGDPDCGEDDDSDENTDDCKERTCDPTYFKCKNGHCIPGRWKCDYYDDCRDGSDEKDCIPRNCSEAEVTCDNGKCIKKTLQCNGEVNCEDGSDEKNCNKSCNPGTEFQCANVKHCIPIRWKCDGDTDCADGTDEWDCSRNCSNEEFRCNNSICQPLLWRCDGDDDCGDGSDEEPHMCAQTVCPLSRFRCKNNYCIWSSLVCDGNKDCKDGSDEVNCPIKQKCHDYDFRCNSTGACISIAFVCDGVEHCTDGSDEKRAVCLLYKRNCTDNNGGCEQKCTQKGCRCRIGFELMENGYDCKAINPCLQWGVCSQKCSHDNQHAVSCSCEKGFKNVHTIENHGSCVAAGDAPTLLIAEESLVLTSSMKSGDELAKPLPGHSKLDDNTIVAMDVDTTGDSWIAFIAVENNGIWSVKKQIISQKTEKRSRREADTSGSLWFGHQKIKGLALDWVLKRIYWTDATTKSIQLRNYDGKQHMHIAEGDMNSPHSIAVDPESGKIFWTDQGNPPKIESADLDGSNRTLLVTSELVWPNGIAVDHANGWVYWCDTKKYTIETMDLYGNGRKIVHKFTAADPPYTLEVFEDFLYVLTYKTWRILKMHKFGERYQKVYKNKEIEPIYIGLDRINDLVVMQENKLKTSITNNCTKKMKTPCDSSMCFNNPRAARGYTCKCPKDATMEDNKCNFRKVDDPCISFKCKHSGNCSLNIHDKPKCSCTHQYTGEHCETDLCDNYCLNMGTCVPPASPSGPLTCRCSLRYRGDRCEIYKCSQFCLNGGICSVDVYGNPICHCPIYFEGLKCEKNKTLTCNDICEKDNWESCASVSNRLDEPRCTCKPGFKGPRCEQCDDLFCYHEGICKRLNNKPFCKCAEKYDSSTNCMDLTCDYLCSSAAHNTRNCDCDNLLGPCLNYCKNYGKCSVTKDNKAKCDCGKFFEGDQCEKCKCEPGGTCTHITNTHTACRCKEGYVGPMCGEMDKAVSSGSKAMFSLYIIIPVLLCIFILIVIISIVFYRRRQRLQQYGHKRMKDNSLNVKNPIYHRHDAGLDDQETGQNLIFRGDASTNFANPMYDVYNGESMPILMQQDNEQMEDGLVVKYFGTDAATSKKTSVA